MNYGIFDVNSLMKSGLSVALSFGSRFSVLLTEYYYQSALRGYERQPGYSADCDMVLWRNVRQKELHIFQGTPHHMLFIDGSTCPSVVPYFRQKAEALRISHYILKDNFAYVWEKTD